MPNNLKHSKTFQVGTIIFAVGTLVGILLEREDAYLLCILILVYAITGLIATIYGD